MDELSLRDLKEKKEVRKEGLPETLDRDTEEVKQDSSGEKKDQKTSLLKSSFLFFAEITKIVVLAFAIVIPIRYFVFQPFIVRGESMLPNFENSDYLLVDEISYRLGEPERGDVIVFKPPIQQGSRYIKRIIGLPGETIQIRDGLVSVIEGDGTVIELDESGYLSDSVFTSGSMKIDLGEGEYFVMGDNRQFSSDSRSFGPLPRENIIGKVFFRALPFAQLSTIKNPILD